MGQRGAVRCDKDVRAGDHEGLRPHGRDCVEVLQPQRVARTLGDAAHARDRGLAQPAALLPLQECDRAPRRRRRPWRYLPPHALRDSPLASSRRSTSFQRPRRRLCGRKRCPRTRLGARARRRAALGDALGVSARVVHPEQCLAVAQASGAGAEAGRAAKGRLEGHSTRPRPSAS